MCGLFGVIDPSGVTSSDREQLGRLSDLLLHRGPDGSGFLEDVTSLFGMHRLSVMDPLHGWQPLWSEDKRFAVLGNGEIYNAAELRSSLIKAGHNFQTHSDIEVVPHLMEDLGVNCFSHLRGMFALIVTDYSTRQVYLVRDKMGEKPLFFYRVGEKVFVSSEQSALVRAGITPPSVERRALHEYLIRGFVSPSDSIISGVCKVPAGSYVQISLDSGRHQTSVYWKAIDHVGDRSVSSESLLDSLREAVHAACISDVPVGLALSGGLDSSLVAVLASEVRPDLSAITIGYQNDPSREAHEAQWLSTRLGLQCHSVILSTRQIGADYSLACAARDEPISDIAGPALMAIPRAANDLGLRVLLTGVGGDELFWGYNWIRQLAALSHSILGRMQKTKMPFFIPRPESLPRSRVERADWVLDLGGIQKERKIESFIRSHRSGGTTAFPFYELQPGYAAISRSLSRLGFGSEEMDRQGIGSQFDVDWIGAAYTIASNSSYLAINSLVQVDRLSMAASVESRTPLADAQLVELVLSGRQDDLSFLCPPKHALREVAAKVLPPEVLARPKRGFTPPVREWSRAIWEQNRSALDADHLIDTCQLPKESCRDILKKPTYKSGRMNPMSLRLLTLELWLRSL